MSDKGNDGFHALASALAIRRSGWHRQEGEGGAIAFFASVPVHPGDSAAQRKLEDEWEARSVAMHAAQRTVLPADKPEENAFAERRKTIRGD